MHIKEKGFPLHLSQQINDFMEFYTEKNRIGKFVINQGKKKNYKLN